MEDMLLSAGSLSAMMSGEFIEEAVLVQVLGSVKLDGIVEEHEHYRLLISDGQHVMSHVMLAVKLTDMGTTTPPERFSVVHVKEYFTTLVPRPGVVRTMLVLADIQVVFPADEIQGPIGTPSALFDEDVVIVPRDPSLISLPEPVFGSVSTVYIDSGSAVEQLSKAAAQEALPVVQALPKVKLQPVTAILSACLPSTVRTIDLSTPDAHVELVIPTVKSPSTQVTPPAVKLTPGATSTPVKKTPAAQRTPPATPKLVQKPSPVQIPTPAVQLTQAATPPPVKKPRLVQITPAATPTPVKKPSLVQITPALQLTYAAAPTLMQKTPPVQRPTPAVQQTHVATPPPVKKPSPVQITSAPVKRPSPVQITPAVQLTHAAAPTPVKMPRLAQIPPAPRLTHAVTPTPMQKPSPVRIPTPVVKAAPGTTCAGSFSTAAPSVTAIANLCPTTRNWIIKSRVTAKSPIKQWASGSGCSFTIDLADESGEIKATVFTEWVNKYFAIFKKDQVYYISKANLKPTNKRFNHLNHDYEMILHGATSVVPCDEQVTVAEAKYKFVPLSEITSAHGSVIDVIGVCISAAEMESVQTRAGVMPKREVTLADQSFTTIGLKLWGEHAETIEPTNRPIIAIRGAMVNEYWGVMNLTTLVSSAVRINPDIPEAQRLRKWFCSSENQ